MVGTKVSIPKGRNGRSLKNFRKTQKNVTRRIGSLSGLPASQRSKRPKDDPFNQIGL